MAAVTICSDFGAQENKVCHCFPCFPIYLPWKSVLNVHWKDWCWSWNSNPLATWFEELTHWKRPWCWERLKAGGEGDDRRWAGWMALLTQWTWVWVSSRSWWWTGKPGVLQSMGSQRVGHNSATELNWTSFRIDWFDLLAIHRTLKSPFIIYLAYFTQHNVPKNYPYCSMDQS